MIRRFRIVLLPVLFCALMAGVVAQTFEQREFQSAEQERRYREIISDLRCLVCQNQNLADSNAPLAADLRDITYNMVRNGKSEEEIHAFMVKRYGDFVLYKPPFNPKTIALWAGPFALLALGLWFLLRQIRKRSAAAAAPAGLDETERERLDAMLAESHDRPQSRRDD